MATTVFFVKPKPQTNQTTPPTTQQQPSTGGDSESQQPSPEQPTPEQPAPEPEPVAKLYEMTEDGKYLYFGEYPQTLKADSVNIVSTTPDHQGCFMGDDGERYYLWNTRYFKVEPLKWRILKQADGKAFVVCDVAVDYLGCCYLYPKGNESGILDNDYKYSDLRKYLTDDFYNRAFNNKEKDIILRTFVDNSLSQTASPNLNLDNLCENTYDYIFALSYAELTNPEYGFSSDPSQADANRTWKATDYSISNGGWVYDGSDEEYPNPSYIGNIDDNISRGNHYKNDGQVLTDLFLDGALYPYNDGPNVENTATFAVPAMWIEL